MILLTIVAVGWAASLADADKVQAVQPAGAPKEKIVCRREVPIGSLIASRKVCLTKARWMKRADDGNEETRRFLEDYVCVGNGRC